MTQVTSYDMTCELIHAYEAEGDRNPMLQYVLRNFERRMGGAPVAVIVVERDEDRGQVRLTVYHDFTEDYGWRQIVRGLVRKAAGI